MNIINKIITTVDKLLQPSKYKNNSNKKYLEYLQKEDTVYLLFIPTFLTHQSISCLVEQVKEIELAKGEIYNVFKGVNFMELRIKMDYEPRCPELLSGLSYKRAFTTSTVMLEELRVNRKRKNKKLKYYSFIFKKRNGTLYISTDKECIKEKINNYLNNNKKNIKKLIKEENIKAITTPIYLRTFKQKQAKLLTQLRTL